MTVFLSGDGAALRINYKEPNDDGYDYDVWEGICLPDLESIEIDEEEVSLDQLGEDYAWYDDYAKDTDDEDSVPDSDIPTVGEKFEIEDIDYSHPEKNPNISSIVLYEPAYLYHEIEIELDENEELDLKKMHLIAADAAIPERELECSIVGIVYNDKFFSVLYDDGKFPSKRVIYKAKK